MISLMRSGLDMLLAAICFTLDENSRYAATTTPSVYMVNGNGEIELRVMSSSSVANGIVVRDGDGRIYTQAPKFDSHATTKGYVDGLIADLQAQIDALKG